ncbi:MAG: 16S rRNA (cytosine(1402)-N(4))-methyltransferase RsmH [Spirochaetales bacterium]|nr:16S rRNA (cytosine(1402)-N(4))-methyltransferase RsmH [Spirochaetales bacterium]MBO7348439.1 16S rRNA (cytosine(1402)-N(4))-methyltransferase RsmH [Spirochaetales bacterium]MBP5756371.1 16S rRNA (cytosine(1402)-N(4))-methyltransferase RsmH [Spirochaetales bacterium]
MQYVHCPVMANEVLSFLNPGEKDALMVDCTLGEGGHTSLFLARYPRLKIIGLDRDSRIMEKARTRMAPYGDRFEAKNIWFDQFWKNYEGPGVDFILFDLGISVFHYEESGRGFSFKREEKLDMRLNTEADLDACDVVNDYDETSLANLIYNYGEERYSRRIAAAICKARQTKRIEYTNELADIIWDAVPNEYRHRRIHPATKTFQALRIEVNGELDRIEPALEGALRALKPGGRIAVITFHSLEDRPVKWFFKNRENVLEILTKKPVEPTQEECEMNPPSRSAKLRVVEKLENERDPAKKRNKYRD